MEQKEMGERAQMKFNELVQRKKQKACHKIYVEIKPNLYIHTYMYLPQATIIILIPLEKYIWAMYKSIIDIL